MPDSGMLGAHIVTTAGKPARLRCPAMEIYYIINSPKFLLLICDFYNKIVYYRIIVITDTQQGVR